MKKVVSCEVHFKWSMDKWAVFLPSKYSKPFKESAMEMMTSETNIGYERSFNGIVDLIQSHPSKLEFLKRVLKFLHQRRYHFCRAFKGSDAPPTNMSESFHSSYVKSNTIKLKLIEAAFRDVAYAVKIKRTFSMFPEGAKCSGSGPSQTQKAYRNAQRQNKRACAFGEDICSLDDDGDESTFVDEMSKHRPCHPNMSDILSSDDKESSKITKKDENRKERTRSRSKKFLETLEKAKNIKCVCTVENNDDGITFKLTSDTPVTVIITNLPTCTCSSFQKYLSGKGKKMTCDHIIFILMKQFSVRERERVTHFFPK